MGNAVEKDLYLNKALRAWRALMVGGVLFTLLPLCLVLLWIAGVPISTSDTLQAVLGVGFLVLVVAALWKADQIVMTRVRGLSSDARHAALTGLRQAGWELFHQTNALGLSIDYMRRFWRRYGERVLKVLRPVGEWLRDLCMVASYLALFFAEIGRAMLVVLAFGVVVIVVLGIVIYLARGLF